MLVYSSCFQAKSPHLLVPSIPAPATAFDTAAPGGAQFNLRMLQLLKLRLAHLRGMAVTIEGLWNHKFSYMFWLVVLAILKNISQWEGLSHRLWK